MWDILWNIILLYFKEWNISLSIFCSSIVEHSSYLTPSIHLHCGKQNISGEEQYIVGHSMEYILGGGIYSCLLWDVEYMYIVATLPLIHLHFGRQNILREEICIVGYFCIEYILGGGIYSCLYIV